MTYCSVVTVLALVGSTKKRFGHYAILQILSLRSSSNILKGKLEPPILVTSFVATGTKGFLYGYITAL